MKMKFDDSGLKKLQKNLDKVSRNNNVPFDELFTNSFMIKNTEYRSIEEFVNDSKFDFKDMESINENELDNFVNQKTNFSTWKQMLTSASELWTVRQLGL